MKMISSTSTTSMSGVTLISALPEPAADIATTAPPGRPALAGGLRPLRDEPDRLEPGLVQHDHHVLHVAEGQVFVPLQDDALAGAALELLGHAGHELILRNRLLILPEPDVAVLLDGHEKLLVGVGMGDRGVRDRELHRLALLQHGRDHHENDQKDEADVHERSDVDLRLDVAGALVTGLHSPVS